jgi:hypothetical protein
MIGGKPRCQNTKWINTRGEGHSIKIEMVVETISKISFYNMLKKNVINLYNSLLFFHLKILLLRDQLVRIPDPHKGFQILFVICIFVVNAIYVN